MASFGPELKQARQKAGMTLEDISGVTRVSVRHLQALENERFDQLPGGVFNRGILRGYLSCAGLDEDEWMRRYAEAIRDSSHARAEDNEWLNYAEKVTGIKPSAPGDDRLDFRWLGAVILVLLTLAVGWLAYHFVVHKH